MPLPAAPGAADRLTPVQAWRLYVVHFLSMWNSRTYEYGAILFIQAAFPGDLLPSSINGIAETICVLVSAGALGRWVDQSPSRLRPLLLTIAVNRITLVVCCLLWMLLFLLAQPALRAAAFAVILGLGMVEKASRMGNTLCMERDWIPTIADDHAYDLTHLNTIVRRIDIACKSLAPLGVSSVVAMLDPTLAAMVVGAIGAASMVLELWTATTVWKCSSRLQQRKQEKHADAHMEGNAAWDGASSHMRKLSFILGRLQAMLLAQVDGLRYYFSTEIWLPSIGTAVLHASVLAWSGTLITWLLNAGLSLPQVTVAKGVGSLFDVASTVIFPWAVQSFERRDVGGSAGHAYQLLDRGEGREGSDGAHADEDATEREESATDRAASPSTAHELGAPSLHRAVVRVAWWAIVGLAISLVPTLAALFYLDRSMTAASASDTSSTTGPTARVTGTSTVAMVFFALLSISFLGRWTYDLAVTQLALMLVPARRRSSFGGTEMALVSAVSLLHWSAAAIWHAQADFRGLAAASVVAVLLAAVAYVRWTHRWWREHGGGSRTAVTGR